MDRGLKRELQPLTLLNNFNVCWKKLKKTWYILNGNVADAQGEGKGYLSRIPPGCENLD